VAQLFSLGSIRTMSYSLPHKFRLVSAYILGVALLLVGIVGFGIQIELGNTSPDPFSMFVLDVVFIICGALTCVATRLRYGGGFWSILGLDFVGFGVIGIASILESHLHGTHSTFSAPFYLRVAVFTVVGFICLALGEIRRHKLKKATIYVHDHAA
jgi:hypothetical protein